MVIVQLGATRIGYTTVGTGGLSFLRSPRTSHLSTTRSTACQLDSLPGSGDRWASPFPDTFCAGPWLSGEPQGTPGCRWSSLDPRPEARGAWSPCRLGLHQRGLCKAESGMSEDTWSFNEWAAKLSQPSVELRVQDDHVTLEKDGELIASGSLSS